MEEKYKKTTKLVATCILLSVTIVWGSSFVVMKNAMEAITPTYILAYRFTIAAAGLVILFFPRMRRMTGNDVKCGLLIGTFLFVSYFLQTYGLMYTTASKNAFITTMYVVVVPFLHWFFNKSKPGRNNITAAFVAVAGLALISLEGASGINIGDVLTLICGICFAFQVVLLDKYTEDHDLVVITVMQIVVCAVLSWVTAPLIEGPCDLAVFGDSKVAIGILYLGLIASMVCFLGQAVGQKFLNANTSSILLSFESVFGLIFSVIILDERLSLKALCGCGLMFAAMILSEYSPAKTGGREEKKGSGQVA